MRCSCHVENLERYAWIDDYRIFATGPSVLVAASRSSAL